MVLYINACVRAESRTDRIARTLLKRLGEYEEVKLSEMGLKPLDEKTLLKRSQLISACDYSDHMFGLAKQFAAADKIVIAAPYWDMSFPAILKLYIENIYVTGLVTKYDEKGVPVGLCKAEKLYYITTSGGPLTEDFGFGYIHSLATRYFGIKSATLIKAEMLDVVGFDAERIVAGTIDTVENIEL